MNRLSVYWLIELNKVDLTNQLVGKKIRLFKTDRIREHVQKVEGDTGLLSNRF